MRSSVNAVYDRRSRTASRRGAVASLALAAALSRPGALGAEGASSVDLAVERGRRWLLPRLAAWVSQPPGGYPMGKIALALAAVLKAGTPSDDETVRRALERLEGMSLGETYSVACYLFALDAYWQAKYRESLRRPAAKGPTAVAPAVSDVPREGPIRSRMEECIRWLVRGSGGTWHYHGRGPGDHSNTQFAILGLEIGLENEIPIPSEVFRSIAEHFATAYTETQTSAEFSVTYRTPAWQGVTTGVSRTASYRGYLGGWTYSGRGGITHTMTAAGVSSLLVARRALERAGEYAGRTALETDRRILGGLGWIQANWKEYVRPGDRVGDCGRTYYALYSVEKVGDIGGIVRIGPVDWYSAGARWLLDQEKGDGSWGNEIDTALALLFLTRATRSHLQTQGPPVLFTRVETREEESDLVYVEKLRGFVPLGYLFEFLAETRDPAVLKVATEAIAAFPPHRTDEILAQLLKVWKDDGDEVTRFAAEKTAELTGARGAKRADAAVLAADFRRVRDFERAGSADPARLEAILRGTKSPALKRRALELVDRLGLAEAFGAVVDLIEDPDPAVRERAKAVLEVWSGKKDLSAQAWREWWAEEGAAFRVERKASALVGRLAAGASEEAIERAIRDLAALGLDAAPSILAAMEGASFSVHLVRALEALAGESAGIRPADWREAIARKRRAPAR
ncbi:MAG: hypothetical protein ACUVYA_11980 [Planctomycetota bacterium]